MGAVQSPPQRAAAPLQQSSGASAPATSRTLLAASTRQHPAGVSPPPRSLHGAAPPPLPLVSAARTAALHLGKVPSPEPPGAAGSWRMIETTQRRRPGRERDALWRRVSCAPGGGRRAGSYRSLGSPHHGRTEGAAAERGAKGAPASEWPAGSAGLRVGSPLPGTAAPRGGERKKTAGWTCGPGDRPAAPFAPESSELLDSGSRHRIAL